MPTNSSALRTPLLEYFFKQPAGEQPSMIADFQNMTALGQINEADANGMELIQDVVEYVLEMPAPIRVANERVDVEWFANLTALPQHRRNARLMEFLKLGVVEYIAEAPLNTDTMRVLHNVLTPKQLRGLMSTMRNGGDAEGELMRLAYVVAHEYQPELYAWWDENFASDKMNESMKMNEDFAQDLSYAIEGRRVVFYSASAEEDTSVASETVAWLSNLSDKDLFDYIYALSLEYVPDAELLAVVDFTLQLQNDIQAALTGTVEEGVLQPSIPTWNTGLLRGGAKGLMEDDSPAPVQDILGSLANRDNIAAQDRYGAGQTGDFGEFDNDGDYKMGQAQQYNKPARSGTSPLDEQINEEVADALEVDDIAEVEVQALRDFDELSLIPIGVTGAGIQDMQTYEVLNRNISELPFYLTIDIPENRCIVNIMNMDGTPMTELTQQLVDYALSTQLDEQGDYIGNEALEQSSDEQAEIEQHEFSGGSASAAPNGSVGGDSRGPGGIDTTEPNPNGVEEEASAGAGAEVDGDTVSFESLSAGRGRCGFGSVLREDELVPDDERNVADAGVDMLARAAANSATRLNSEMGAGNSGLNQYADSVLSTSDPEVAFDLRVIENDDGSITIEGNIPVVINALTGIQAAEVKADLLGETEDEFNLDNNPTVVSH